MATELPKVKDYLSTEIYESLEKLYLYPDNFAPRNLPQLNAPYGLLKSNGQNWSVRYFWGNETALKAHLLFLVGYSKDHLIVEVYNP